MENYSLELRKRILEDLKKLSDKIETNEPCPEEPQTIELLIDISDKIEECLNNWNY